MEALPRSSDDARQRRRSACAVGCVVPGLPPPTGCKRSCASSLYQRCFAFGCSAMTSVSRFSFAAAASVSREA